MTFPTLSKRVRLGIALVLVAGALAFGAVVYWRKVYSQPVNVFNRMLSNALTTSSVAKHSVVSSDGQTISQVTDLFLSPNQRVHGLINITQKSIETSTVKRETLTTTSDSYVRLVSVDTTQKNSNGQAFDFSSITGVWGHTPADDSTNSLSQLFGQNVAVPYANLSVKQRKDLLSQIQTDGVYEVDTKNAQHLRQNGRPVMQFPVTVKPDAFIKMMKTLGLTLGVKGFEQVNAADYKNLPKVSFTFTVDILSGDLIKVDYGNGQIEDYSGYGIRTLPNDPADAIPMSQLQNRLQNLQR